MPALAADDSLVGFVLADKYRIVRVIGKGGMGIVYEAEHMVLGKRVAIKLMLEKYFEDSEAKNRFKREAVAASRIGNPHIIDVSDIGDLPDGRSFVVMELLQGKPLSEVLETTGPMPPYRAMAIMRQVLRAVGAAHAKGIIHRDLKPDNIFLIDQGDHHDFVKLLDFGISKIMDPNEQIAFTKLTTTGVVMGTPLYMAPEQAMGQPAMGAADIYACGVILYELLSGRTPFIGQTYAVLVAQLLTAPPEPLPNLRPGLPLALVNAVHKALEKEPARRHASAEMFAASLPGDRTVSEVELAGTLDSGFAVAAKLPTGGHPAGKKSRATLFAVIGALVLGVATAGILIATQTGAESTKTASQPPQVQEAQRAEQKLPPVEPPVETGLLRAESVPEGATVFVDGNEKGTAPLEITLSTGKHTLRFERADHEPLEVTTKITAGSNQYTGTMVKAKPGSRPSGSRPSSSKPTTASGKPSGTKPASGSTRPATVEQPTAPEKPRGLVGPKPDGGETPPVKKPDEPIRKPDDKTAPGTKTNPYTQQKDNPYKN